MKMIENDRLRAYLDWVERNYADDVVGSFRAKIELAPDPERINLSSVLKQAIRESKKTADLQKDLVLGLNSHCRS
jgi:hypothetical protein